MSVRSFRKVVEKVHTLDDAATDNVVVTVTETKDLETGTKDVVVEKDTYVDGKIAELEVDTVHVEAKGGHVETTHIEAGNGTLEIDREVKDVIKGHVEVRKTHTEVKDNHLVEIVTVTDSDIKGNVVSKGTNGEVKDVVLRRRKESTASSKSSSSFCSSCSSASSDDDDDHPTKKRCTCCTRGVHRVQKHVTAFVHTHSRMLTMIFNLLFVLMFYAYFIYAMIYKFGDEGSIRLLCITILFTLYLVYRLSRIALKKKWTCCCWLVSCCNCIKKAEEGFWRIAKYMKLKIILCVVMALFFLVYSIVVVGLNQPHNLISAAGMVMFILLFFILSDNPERVKWRPVFCGLSMQFVFAMLLMRTTSGKAVFLYFGQRLTEFMEYANHGAEFVFGPNFAEHFFAFKVLPVVILFGSCISVLYHLGVMQFFIKHFGRALTLLMDTSPVENVVAIANIFVGQIEAPVLAGPYLKTMTRSQLHTIMTSGFATAAGPIMAAFSLYEIPMIHLLSASVMSAPAAIGMSKLFYPETEPVADSYDSNHIFKIKGRATNVIEAASDGAVSSIKIIANILTHLIAFVSLLVFLNAVFIFLGHRVGLIAPEYPELTFQLIYSYFFWPFALAMGIDIGDCQKVAEMIGTKMVINEFAAYSDLSTYITNKRVLVGYLDERNLTMATGYMTSYFDTGADILLNDTQQVLAGGILSDRSTVISVYALCGFSNFSAMGIMLGVLRALVPERHADLSRVVFRAMVAGNVATFMTACMAGLLYSPDLVPL